MKLLRLGLAVILSLVLVGLISPSVQAEEESGSTDLSATTLLTISDISVSTIGYYSATISWKTNGNATSQVFYDTVSHNTTAGYRYYTSVSTTLVSNHSRSLTGLASSTTYHFRVKSVIPGTQFVAISNDYTFTTLTPPPVVEEPPPTPPVVTPPPPGTTPVSDIVTTTGVFTEKVVAESFDKVCYLTITAGTRGLTKEKEPLSQITMVEVKEPPSPPENAYAIGLVYDFGPDGATFDPPIMLTIRYDPSLIREGVNEEYLVIAYYDEDTGKWIELDSVVDTKANTISAKVSHFSKYAIFGYKVVVPLEKEEIVPLAPAVFLVSNLSIKPLQVQPGELVTITVSVANTGGTEGSYTVVLKINGVADGEKSVTIAAGRSQSVSFTRSKGEAGRYAVTVDGLSGSFTVVVAPAKTNWPLIGLIGGIIVMVLAIFLVLRRRHRLII